MKYDPWRFCRHCAKRFTSKGIARHEQACMPEVTHDCEQCGQAFRTARMLSLHRSKAHPGGIVADDRLARLRTIAADRGWLVVSDEPDCVLAVRVADPVTVVHARPDSDRIVGRVVSRARGPRLSGSVDADAPVPLTLDLASFDDVRAVLERL